MSVQYSSRAINNQMHLLSNLSYISSTLGKSDVQNIIVVAVVAVVVIVIIVVKQHGYHHHLQHVVTGRAAGAYGGEEVEAGGATLHHR